MVAGVMSLTGNGLKDWLIQRITALYLIIFICGWLGYFCCHPIIDYQQWHDLFQCRWVQVTSSLAVLAIVAHAWVGIWTVTTDYLRCVMVRLPIQIVIGFVLFSELVWGFKIVWGQ